MLVGVAIATVLVATLPYGLNGFLARRYLQQDLPVQLDQAGVVLENTRISAGLYRSDFSTRLRIPAQALELDLEGHLQHRLSGVDLHAAPPADSWHAIVAALGSRSRPPAPLLQASSSLSLSPSPHIRTRGEITLPALHLEFANASESVTASPARGNFELDATGAIFSVVSESVETRLPGGGVAVFAGLRARIDARPGAAADPASPSVPPAETVALELQRGAFRSAALDVVVENLRLSARWSAARGSRMPRIAVVARTLTSRGVPYVRLDDLRADVSFRASESAASSAPRLVLEGSATSRSNFGSLCVRVASNMDASRGLAAHALTDARGVLAMTLPEGLAGLLFKNRPELQRRWRGAGMPRHDDGRIKLQTSFNDDSTIDDAGLMHACEPTATESVPIPAIEPLGTVEGALGLGS